MRTSIAVGLVAVCLGLAGCNLFNKKKDAEGPSRPFLGSRSPAAPAAPAATPTGGAEVQADPAAPLPGASGVLAGQVVDRFNNHPAKVYIQVVDTQDGKPAGRLEVESQQGGFFYIPGLKPGHSYKLIARTKEGEKVLAGTTLAKPPNPRLSIFLSEDFAGDAPPVPDQPTVPGIRSPGGDGARLDPPEKSKPGEVLPKNDISAPSNPTGAQMWAPNPNPPATPPAPQPTMGVPVPHPENMVDGKDNTNGNKSWGNAPPPPKVDMPGPLGPPASPLPPAPQWAPGLQTPLPPVPGSSVSPAPETPAFPGVHLPSVTTPVPSCVLVGRRLDNFALNDLNFHPWEYRTNCRGKVVLIDFWFSTCMPCRMAIGHLVKLQQTYGPYGLDVVGIAYERGTPEEQVRKVREIRARYGINYTTLLGAGPTCPVKTQFRVERFPTLFLLDRNGQIVWDSGESGLGDENTRWILEAEIRRQLNMGK